jgi:glycosyltransferase involved in cell wall biosynthesis
LTVSVLIPAFRPTYLRQAIASVLTQGYADFELLIGDDNPGDLVEHVVDEFRDKRIRRLRTAGGEGAMENVRMLWRAASRPLLKYLFDDDLLLPHALGVMVDAMQAHPSASFCFCNRYIINENGQVTEELKPIPEGVIGLAPHDVMVRSIGITGLRSVVSGMRRSSSTPREKALRSASEGR